MPTVVHDDPVATLDSAGGFSVPTTAGGAPRMPMIDVYAVEGTFADKHAMARDLAAAARAEIAQHTQSATSS
jgi:hypothetical protein